MKKLLFLLFLFISLISKSQVINRSGDYVYKNKLSAGRQSEQPTPNSVWFMVGDSGTNRAMVIPRVTNRANVDYPRLRGMNVWDLSNNKPYWWDGGQWITIDTSGTGGGPGGLSLLNTGFGIIGGPISTTGTVEVDTFRVASFARLYKVVDSLPGYTPDGNTYPTTLSFSGINLTLGRFGTTALNASIDTFWVTSFLRTKKIADSLGALIGASSIINVGTGLGWYKTRVGNTAQFKSFINDSTLGATSNANDISLTVNSNTTTQKIEVYKNGAFIGNRKAINIIDGTNITTTLTNNAGLDRVDITLVAAGTAEPLYPEAGAYNAGFAIGDSLLFPINDSVLTWKRFRAGYALIPWAVTDTTFGARVDTNKVITPARLDQFRDSLIAIGLVPNYGEYPGLVDLYNGAPFTADTLISELNDSNIVIKSFKISGSLIEPIYGFQGYFLQSANITDSTFGISLNPSALSNYITASTLMTRTNSTTTSTNNLLLTGNLYIGSVPFVAGKDTVAYWDPITNQLKRTLVVGGGGGGEPAIAAGLTTQYWRGDKTWQLLNSTVVPEGTNLYFNDGRARSAISLTTTGSSGASTYNGGTGVFNIPNYTLAGLGGEPIITAGTASQVWIGNKTWLTLNTANVPESGNLYYTDSRSRNAISATSPLSYISGTGVLSILLGTGSQNGYIASTDWTRFDAKQQPIQFKNAGANQGGLGAVSVFDVTGGATGSFSGGTFTINVPASTNIQYKDEGTNQGAAGAVNTIDFTGAGVSAAFSAGILTVTVAGGGAGADGNNFLSGVTPTDGNLAFARDGLSTLNASISTSIIPEGSRLYYTDARSRASLSLTTSGSSGAATYNSGTGAWNIPNYTLGGLGGEPTIASGTLTQYWRGDKSWQELTTSVVTEGSNQYYTNARVWAAVSATGTGLSYNGSGQFTNTAPDQAITLTQSSNIIITGSYPNFTIAATDNNTIVTDLVYSLGSTNIGTLTLSQTGQADIVRNIDIGIRSFSGGPFNSILKSNIDGNAIVYGIAPGSGMTSSNDGNSIFLSQVANSTIQKIEFSSNGTLQGARKELNFQNGLNTTVSVTDNPGSDQTDISVSVPTTTLTPINGIIVTGTFPNFTIGQSGLGIYAQKAVIGLEDYLLEPILFAQGQGPVGVWENMDEVLKMGHSATDGLRTITVNAVFYMSKANFLYLGGGIGGGSPWIKIGTIPASHRPGRIVSFPITNSPPGDGVAGSRYRLQNGMTPSEGWFTGASAYINALDGGIYVKIPYVSYYSLGPGSTEWLILPIHVTYFLIEAS